MTDTDTDMFCPASVYQQQFCGGSAEVLNLLSAILVIVAIVILKGASKGLCADGLYRFAIYLLSS